MTVNISISDHYSKASLLKMILVAGEMDQRVSVLAVREGVEEGKENGGENII